MQNNIEKRLLTVEFYLRRYLATASLTVGIVFLGVFGYLIYQNQDHESSIQGPVYDQVEMARYEACLADRITGTMWYWPKSDALVHCNKYLPSNLNE